jgi:SAM-dependent methyltransferase
MTAISISIPAGRRILDFGCGTGWVVAGAQATGPVCRVGVDLSLASLRAGKQSFDNIHFVAGSGLRLPFGNASFDVVVGHVSMPYMDTLGALREIYRVLAPGGAFLLTFHTLMYARRFLWASLVARQWKAALSMVYVIVNGALNHFGFPQIPAFWNRRNFETINTASGVAKTARKAGFFLVSVEHQSARIFFAATGRKPNPETDEVLPHPGWSIYCRLSGQGLPDGREIRSLSAVVP